MNIWDLLSPRFKKTEAWGDPALMDPKLLWVLYCIRCDLHMPIVIHGGYESRASGYHPLGKAVDFHFVSDESLNDQYDTLEKYLSVKEWGQLLGLGIYPDWNNQGFHLDTRGTSARWGRIEITVNNELVKKYVSIGEALKWKS